MSGWQAVQQGGWKAVTPPSRGVDMAKSIASGLVRAVPKTIDAGGSLAAEAYNLAAGDAPMGTYSSKGFSGEGPLNQAMSAALGPEYQPEYASGDVAKFLAELTGGVGGGALKLLKNAGGFVKGAAGSLDDFIRDPEQLRQVYIAWKQGLEQVPLKAGELQQELVDPALQEIGHDARYLTREGKQKVGELKGLGQRDTTMGDVYALRKSLGQVNDPAATEPIRSATRNFMEKRVGTDGLDAYRRYATAGEVQHAMRNAGNEGVKATRTKINNLDEAGMTPAEIVAKQAAGRPGLAEALLRGAGNKTLAASVAFGPLGFIGGIAGKGLAASADNIAKAKMQALQQVLINGRQAPSLGERAGYTLRRILMKAR